MTQRPHDDNPWQAWRDAVRRTEIDTAIQAIYRDLDADVAARSPTCWLSGRCCRFEAHGHRLFVTGLEISWLLEQLDSTCRTRLRLAPLPQFDGCPFQHNNLCTVHALRPLGCRIYFCDPTARDWQNEVYESFLTRLRNLHEQKQLEYRYMEWRQGLAEAKERRI